MTVLRAALLQQRLRIAVLLAVAVGIAGVASILGAQAVGLAHDADAILSNPHRNLQETLIAENLTRSYAMDALGAWLLSILYPLSVVVATVVFITSDVRSRRLLFAWTQGVKRSTWLAAQFAVLTASGVLGTVLIMPALLFAMSPVRAGLLFPAFDGAGLAVPLYAAFGSALALFLGLRMPSLVAVPLSVGGYAAIRYLVAMFLRPIYLPPKVVDVASNSGSVRDLGWTVHTYCGAGSQLVESSGGCINAQFVRLIYQPESRFWVMQSIEATLFAVLAVGFVALALFVSSRIDLSPS